MSISVLAETVIDFPDGGSASYSTSAFAVPGGTDCLVVDILARGYSSTGVCTIDAITHHALPLTVHHDNAAAGFDPVNSYIAYRRNPDVGTFALAISFDLQTRGCAVRIQALAGVKQSGSPIGQIQAQRTATAATDTVGLGLTPAATADSLLCASLGISTSTTLTTWTGAGFVEQDTDTFTGGGNLTATFRRRLNAPASANTAQAKFGASTNRIGGLLYEILAEPTGVDVSGGIDFTLAMSGSVSGPASAKLSDAAYYSGDAAWTDIWVLQPDFAGVDRRIHSVGPDLAPNMALDQVATGTYATNCFRLRTRLSTGELVIETLPGSQSTGPTVLAFSYGADGAAAYVNGAPSLASAEAGISGTVDVGAGGEAIGGHAAASPPPYTGKIARHMRFRGQMSAAQVALLSRSVLDPGSIWGIGQEDDAEDPNQSPVALPELVRPDGRPMVRITPRVIDPNGTPPDITGVTQPVHGAVSIDGRDLVLNLEPGWVGSDGFTYTATDAGGKSSTARIVIEQLRPALLAQGDAITLTESSSVTFDPRVNDVGAGMLRIASATDGAHGTTAILADGRIVFTAGAVTGDTSDSFSYTITDDWGSATATVAVTIRESGTSFVSASNDSVETTTGVAVPINVLANDTASSDNLPLVVKGGSITTPNPSGTAALQGDGRILYTPASGFTGDASFDYAIKPASKAEPTSIATVLVRVVSILTARPKYPFGFTSWTAVPVTRIRPVGFGVTGAPGPAGGYASLANAYAAAVAGDWIVLADSTYAENFDFNRDFPAANPVVITSRNVSNGRSPMGNFTGQPTITGNGHWFFEVRWTSTSPVGLNVPSAYRPTISANNITITRCWFNTPNGPDIQGSNDRTGINIGWCRFVTTADRIGAFILCRVNNTPGSPIPKLRKSAFYNNYFNKTGASVNGNDAYNIYFVAEHKLDGISASLPDVYIEYNYLTGSNQMSVYLKRHPTRLNFNHAVNGGTFGIRHGPTKYAENSSYNSLVEATPTQMWGNRVVGPNMILNGADIDARGNYVKNGRGILLFSGNKNAGGGVAGNYQAASDALLVGNNVDRSGGLAPINVGYHDKADDLLSDEDGGKIRNVRIFGQLGDTIKTTGPSAEGNIIFDPAQCLADTVTITLGNGGFTVPATITLNPDTDVGFQVANQNLST